MVGITLRIKINLDREKNSPFECGFTPKIRARIPFSIRFFLISILFLVFDVEIVLLFPFISSLFNTILVSSQFFIRIFLITLLLGLYYEINQGSINWAA